MLKVKLFGKARKMSKRFVSFSHAMDIVAFFDRGADTVVGVGDLSSQFLGKGVIFAITSLVRVFDEPADRETELAAGRNRHRDLVGSTTDTAGADLGLGLDVVQGGEQGVEWFATQFLTQNLHRLVDLLFGDGLFPIQHLLALAATLFFVLFAREAFRWYGKRVVSSWIFVGVSAMLLIAADVWLLVWG